MYEQYLRDPASVGEEWRNLFDNGKLTELPVIPTSREEVAGPGPRDPGPGRQAQAPSPGLTPITGPAARLVQNMTDSLSVPTATSFREVVVDRLDASGKKISFTHLIGFAIVRAAQQLPVMTHAFQEVQGKPHRLDPQGVNLGLAVDVEKKDRSRALVVPVIKHAERMDFAGATITLPNPGTIGTVASVPRLLKGHGSIIATGAIRQIGPAKVMTLTSTYDHRVIQGAESGMFLRKLDSLLQGDERFYEQVAESLGLTGGGSRESGLGTAMARALPSPEPRAPSPDLKHVAA